MDGANKQRANGNKVLKAQTDYKHLFFYQKSDVLYQMTFCFCDKFLPPYGDRTRDQMIQAARSGKQNIVEGLSDGVTSTEMMLKLLNVGRSSLQELLEDYLDYAKAHGLIIWDSSHPRYNSMLAFCRKHNALSDYQPFFSKWNAEEFCNIAISLCHITDKMLTTYLKKEEQSFVTEGGIKERMYKARTNYRRDQDIEYERLRREVPVLKAEIARLRKLLQSHGINCEEGS